MFVFCRCRKRGDFKKLVESGERSFQDQEKRDLLRYVHGMTAWEA